MGSQATWIVSATLQGLLAAIVGLFVISFLCSIIAPEAFGVPPALLGIAIWGASIALGVVHGRAVWKKRQREPRGFLVITDHRSEPSEKLRK